MEDEPRREHQIIVSFHLWASGTRNTLRSPQSGLVTPDRPRCVGDCCADAASPISSGRCADGTMSNGEPPVQFHARSFLSFALLAAVAACANESTDPSSA